MTREALRIADLKVARIGLGTNRLARTPGNITFIKEAVAAGVGMIDTAHLYTGGQSEETIGAVAVSGPRCVVATKGGHGGAHPETLRGEIEDSLRRLRTDSIALYYLHRVDPTIPLETSLAVIKEYGNRGQIKSIGVSEVSIEQIERARAVMPIAAVQNEYNISERKHDAVVDYCTREGIAFVPLFPLRGSVSRPLKAIAVRHGTTRQQIVLAWLLRRSPMMLPIPGTLSIAHLRENMAALQVELSDAEFEALR